MVRLMKSHVTFFCISLLLVFVCHWCERNEHHHMHVFGVSPPKDCTPRCIELKEKWCCCGECFGIAKRICKRKCSEKKSCC
ncbi:hypothetical protein Hanom_Chr16g01443321 [Helianthus anomalus]